MKLPELEIRKTAELSKEHLRVVIHLENVGKDIARDVYLSDSYPPSLFEIISGITEWKDRVRASHTGRWDNSFSAASYCLLQRRKRKKLLTEIEFC
ncbi:hypothetical protein B6U74_07175 [Candidatus Bathyarchaeota archaeon ex4484_205]|nr:MAG: hypothetical protein B6U74_07175 [Candidatus Bathyarchaeota archaeon ex4484_205]